MATCDDVVTYARSFDGLSADPKVPDARARYLDLVAANEAPERAAQMGEMSGCALVQRGILRAFIDHPILAAPYRTSAAFGDLLTIARQAGALHGSERSPEAADIVFVGDMGDGKGGGVGHVFMALEAPDGDGTLDGLDGGQRDGGGFEMVKVRRHAIADGCDRAGSTDPGGGQRRLVRYVIDVGAVLAAMGR